MADDQPANSWSIMVEFDQEDDGRWIAAINDIPGCMVYGATRELAKAAVLALASRIIAEDYQWTTSPPVGSELI